MTWDCGGNTSILEHRRGISAEIRNGTITGKRAHTLRNETWGNSAYFRAVSIIGLFINLLKIRPNCGRDEIVSGGAC